MQALEYPTYKLPNGVTYRLRMSLSSVMRLRQNNPTPDGPQSAEDDWKSALAEMAAFAYVDQPLPEGSAPGTVREMAHAGLTPDDVAAMYPADPDWWEYQDLRKALNEAISFRPPAGESSQS